MKKNEKGILQIDFATAFLIFALSSALILTMYYNIYVIMTRIKVNEALIGYVTEICEEIDLENYDDITTDRVNEIIKATNIPKEYNLKLNSISKYSDTDSNINEDVVEKLNFTANYEIAGKEQKYSINKVKIKEIN